MSLTAIQKTRQTLTGSPDGVPVWEHAGADVVRWITGGSLPDLYITFHHENGNVLVKCASCQRPLGMLPADFNARETAPVLAEIRQSHICP